MTYRMKRILLLLMLASMLPLAAATPDGRVSKTRMSAFISEYRNVNGVEVVRLGTLATAALKGTMRIAARGDSDAKEALRLIKGLKGIYAFDYEDCSPSMRVRIDRRLRRILDDSELLMEANDEGETMQIYGVFDEDAGKVRDFVLYDPSSCALICLFGSISMNDVSKLVQ